MRLLFCVVTLVCSACAGKPVVGQAPHGNPTENQQANQQANQQESQEVRAAQATGFAIVEEQDRLKIAYGGRPVADFVFRDAQILRPYFANVRAPGGTQVTRRHPPVPGQDAEDHATMHPGIWYGFGDLNGADFWRNQGRMEHVRFVVRPQAHDDRVTFSTEAKLTEADGNTLGTVIHAVQVRRHRAGWLIVWDATFQSDDGPLVFGDQEEMGFGARVATPFTEKNGGRLVNSKGQRTARDTWGQPARWCDYSGTIDNRAMGITLMADPANFRTSWWHNRDYGVFVANAFGRAAMRQGEPSAVTVPEGKAFRLRYGALIHDAAGYEPEAAYRDFVGLPPK